MSTVLRSELESLLYKQVKVVLPRVNGGVSDELCFGFIFHNEVRYQVNGISFRLADVYQVYQNIICIKK